MTKEHENQMTEMESKPAKSYAKCKAVRVASEMTAKELTAALAPLYEEIPRGHRVKPNGKLCDGESASHSQQRMVSGSQTNNAAKGK